MSENFILTDSEYKSGFVLDEYNGVYSLVEARQGTDEKVYKKWGYIEKRDKGDDGKYESKPGKKRPWGVALGMREEAIRRLREVLVMLGDEPDGPERMDPLPANLDTVPF